MIRRLQKKFILLTMTAVLAVLGVIIAGINIVNYRSVVEEQDEILEILAENGGTFPGLGGGPGRPDDSGMHQWDPDDDLRPEDDDEEELPEDGIRPDDPFARRGFSQELAYESRFFSVVLDEETGAVVSAETGSIARIGADEAEELAREVLASGEEKGFRDEYRFRADDCGEGRVRIVFLDSGRMLDSFRDFLLTSVLISLIGFAVVLVIVVILSNRIIRPISDSYEKQKRFITDAGHELKTPLTIINADVEVQEMETGESEWLADIRRQTGRLTALTQDLILLTRMEESEQSMQKIDFSLSDALTETAASFQALAQTQGKDFLCEVPPLLTMNGNEKAIRQLTGILLDNALKYSPEGGTVRLKAEKAPRGLRLSVFNTTREPVPRDQLPRLFDRFYRADSSRSSETGGHGIGLSVAKAIVAAHGGKIHAEAGEPGTITFVVTFPNAG